MSHSEEMDTENSGNEMIYAEDTTGASYGVRAAAGSELMIRRMWRPKGLQIPSTVGDVLEDRFTFGSATQKLSDLVASFSVRTELREISHGRGWVWGSPQWFSRRYSERGRTPYSVLYVSTVRDVRMFHWYVRLLSTAVSRFVFVIPLVQHTPSVEPQPVGRDFHH